jgi:hypothetical protein
MDTPQSHGSQFGVKQLFTHERTALRETGMSFLTDDSHEILTDQNKAEPLYPFPIFPGFYLIFQSNQLVGAQVYDTQSGTSSITSLRGPHELKRHVKTEEMIFRQAHFNPRKRSYPRNLEHNRMGGKAGGKWPPMQYHTEELINDSPDGFRKPN